MVVKFVRLTANASRSQTRGLAAVTLILWLAFTLSAAFTHGHSKLVRRYRLSNIEVARQLRSSVSKLPSIRAPDSLAPEA